MRGTKLGLGEEELSELPFSIFECRRFVKKNRGKKTCGGVVKPVKIWCTLWQMVFNFSCMNWSLKIYNTLLSSRELTCVYKCKILTSVNSTLPYRCIKCNLSCWRATQITQHALSAIGATWQQQRVMQLHVIIIKLWTSLVCLLNYAKQDNCKTELAFRLKHLLSPQIPASEIMRLTALVNYLAMLGFQ